MKLMQEAEDAIRERKLLKSQVEKRRRERMNHSLERLRSMLMQEPQQVEQGAAQRRVEKTEILEHTVLFLHNNSSSKASVGPQPQQCSFQEGFHSCLQKAAHFLGPEGKGLWLALDASFIQRSSSTSSSSTSSILHLLRHRRAAAAAAAQPSRTPAQGQKWLGTCMESPPAEGPSLGQSVWRPWP
ncbi:hairy and enhancer of split related-7 [Syngnathus acus]|uniref:hairy and enhancer of split related-7 n=1 Tax=Syngnathus acus TaxID=161584 RepID=UPI001885FC2C|nr:hairy and enhancer of split related-7 [Syngnathus acus]